MRRICLPPPASPSAQTHCGAVWLIECLNVFWSVCNVKRQKPVHPGLDPPRTRDPLVVGARTCVFYIPSRSSGLHRISPEYHEVKEDNNTGKHTITTHTHVIPKGGGHLCLERHKRSTPRGARVVGDRSHGALSGDAPRERPLLELENAVVDAEGVRHDNRVRDASPTTLAPRALGR